MTRRTPDARELERRLAQVPLRDALGLIASTFAPGRVAVVSAFGPASMIVIHELHELGIRLPVVFIDTLHHFAETLTHVAHVKETYDLDLRVYRPAESRAEFEELYGERLWERDLDRYQEVAKVQPFRRATAELDGWITGRRREQSDTRADLPLVEDRGQLRINPLSAWTRTDVWRFILDHHIPYNPLHDLGYTSIGDEPLTTPVGAGEDERAGRWRGVGRTECGIHFTG